MVVRMENRYAGMAMLIAVLASFNTSYSQSFLPHTTPPTGDLPFVQATIDSADTVSHLNAWGVDILVSNDGFGLGTFYRREFSEDLYGTISLSISEAKESREVELVDFFGNIVVPGKLNRFLVVPLTVGLQQRFFREEILDSFRPYVNAGAGPAMVFSAPFNEIIYLSSGPNDYLVRPVEFFESLGKGQAHYTLGAFLGFGANFGTDKSNLFGLNFRYYFTYLFGDGLASLYDGATGKPAQYKKSFGGFFITLNVGMVY